MKKKHTAQSAFLNLCILLGLLVLFAGIVLALFAAATPQVWLRERGWHAGQHVHRANGPPVAPAGGVYEGWVARYNGTGNG
jgi:hypothetical protein